VDLPHRVSVEELSMHSSLVAEESGSRLCSASDGRFRPSNATRPAILLRGDRRSRDFTCYHLGVAQCTDRDIIHLEPIGEHIAAVLAQ